MSVAGEIIEGLVKFADDLDNLRKGRLMMRFVPDISEESMRAFLRKYPVTVVRLLPTAKGAIVECESGQEEELCVEISLHEEIQFAKPIDVSKISR